MAATIVNAVLSDFGLITEDNTNFVNLLGERHKYRDSEEQEFYKFVDGIYNGYTQKKYHFDSTAGSKWKAISRYYS